MTREEFIIHSINKVFKPVLYLILLSIGIYFFGNAYQYESDIERNIIYAALFVIGVFLILGLLSFLFNTLWKSTPDKLKVIAKKTEKVLGYVLIPIVTYFCYVNWQELKWRIIILSICYLIIHYYKKLRQKIEA